MNSGIYQIYNKIDGKRYIGSAINLRSRFYAHKEGLNKNVHFNQKLQRSWNKYGKDSFEFIILEYVENKEHLIIREQHWMEWFDVVSGGYNICPIAGSRLGTKLSEEHKKKLVNSNPSRRGHSEETKAKISFSMSSKNGRKISDETRRKMSANSPHRKQTEEHKKKLSVMYKGKKRSLQVIKKLKTGGIVRRLKTNASDITVRN